MFFFSFFFVSLCSLPCSNAELTCRGETAIKMWLPCSCPTRHYTPCERGSEIERERERRRWEGGAERVNEEGGQSGEDGWMWLVYVEELPAEAGAWEIPAEREGNRSVMQTRQTGPCTPHQLGVFCSPCRLGEERISVGGCDWAPLSPLRPHSCVVLYRPGNILLMIK